MKGGGRRGGTTVAIPHTDFKKRVLRDSFSL